MYIFYVICIDQLIHIDPIGAIDPIDLPSPDVDSGMAIFVRFHLY